MARERYRAPRLDVTGVEDKVMSNIRPDHVSGTRDGTGFRIGFTRDPTGSSI